MQFKKRITAPAGTNKYYIHTSGGGYNECIIVNTKTKSCIPNCVGYAYGRFMEECGLTSCKLPTCNAESWLKKVQESGAYKTGIKPKLGAVIVWSKGKVGVSSDGAGHVAIVEEIYNDGSFLVSNSAYNNTRFYTKKIGKNCKYNDKYKFEGFIYPPVEFNDWEPGNYTTLKSKYVRTTPEVINGKNTNKVHYNKITNEENKNKCYADKLGYARTKINVTFNLTEFTKDKKGNTWGKLKYSWICVQDSTGKQVK